jgi:hypothetical protein
LHERQQLWTLRERGALTRINRTAEAAVVWPLPRQNAAHQRNLNKRSLNSLSVDVEIRVPRASLFEPHQSN